MNRNWSHPVTNGALLVATTLLAGCSQQMASQPSYGPLKPSDFFPDKRSARPPVPGTVARGRLNDDDVFFTGRVGPDVAAAAKAAAGPGLAAVGSQASSTSSRSP